MAEDGEERGQSFSILKRNRREARCEENAAGKPDGNEALAGIQYKSERAEFFCAGAHDVGCSDIAAAFGANILFEEEAHQQESEGNRAKKISCEANQEISECGHRAYEFKAFLRLT